MTLIRTVGALGLAGIAAAHAPAALALENGWYGGIGIGQSREENHHGRIAAQLQGMGLTTNSIVDDNRDSGFKLFAGKKFSDHFALEGGYFDLGKFGFVANTTPAGTLAGTIQLRGLNFDAVGMLPFTEKLSAFARAGLTYVQARDTFAGTGAVTVTDPNPRDSGANYKYGFGVQYDLTRSLGLRGEWERYRVKDAVGNKGDIDMALIGLVYRFGGTPREKPRAQAPVPYSAPVASAPAPAPAPVLVIVPVAAKTQQYCSILDLQFEINQQTVQIESEERINVVGNFMRKYPATTAVIEGHSDEVGTAAENMKLSERRAESVVDYLVDRNGVARSRLKAVGYGESRPIADNSTREGKRLNRRINAIIACATDIEGIAAIPVRTTMAMEMEFDTNRADVRPQYRGELGKVAAFMKANPRLTATVEGHTSNQSGTAAQAQRLSEQRAQNVVDALVNEFRADRTRLFTAGFGATRRFAYNTSAEGRQENRRVNIIFDYPN